MKTVERHKKTDFGDVWYVNAADGTYRFAVYKYDDDDETIYLSNVFVKEDSRRQGYGNEILTSAEDYAKRLNASVICLKVLIGSDVHRWYKRHGYEDLEKDEEERGYMWMKKELKKIDESHWSEMNRRSQGITVRKEDGLEDGLNVDEFFDYLKSVYIPTTVCVPEYYTITVQKIVVPVLMSGLNKSAAYVCMIGFENNDLSVIIDDRSWHRLHNRNRINIRKTYDLEFVRGTLIKQGYVKITKKTGEPTTNSFFIEVIDFILNDIQPGDTKLVEKIR